MCLAPSARAGKRAVCRLALLLALAGCGTARERCVEDAAFEVRRLSLLAEDSRAALERGYRAAGVPAREVTRWPCGWGTGRVANARIACDTEETVVRESYGATDPGAEAARLSGLEARLAAERAALAAAAAGCAAAQ